MSPVYDCTSSQTREEGIAAAKYAADQGDCVVMPTDTVYGIGTDAFNPAAVQKLLEAKGRGREMPPPVLVPALSTVEGLATGIPSYARRLMQTFWPGGLTLIFRAQPSLAWDLGDNNGTVGLRMPDDEIALELLSRVGPMAVSSANRTGNPTATTITEAGFALGPAVEVYLDGGARSGREPSTIVDCTTPDPVLLREGAISPERLREVLAGVELIEPPKLDRFDVSEPVDLSKPADICEPDDGFEPLDLSKHQPESDSLPTSERELERDAGPTSETSSDS